MENKTPTSVEDVLEAAVAANPTWKPGAKRLHEGFGENADLSYLQPDERDPVTRAEDDGNIIKSALAQKLHARKAPGSGGPGRQ